MLDILCLVVGYAVLTLVLLFIAGSIERKLSRSMEQSKQTTIQAIIAGAFVATLYRYLPTHSLPYCLFFAGQCGHMFWKDNFSSALSLVGIIWGAYNLFIK